MTYRTVLHPRYKRGLTDHDLGVYLLSSAPPVTPVKIASWAPSAGEAVTLVGHGETEAGGGSEVKRLATNTIAGVQELIFRVEGRGGDAGNACPGDSGTPGFTTGEGGQEALAGVVTKVLGCDDTTLTRLDAHMDWLKEAAGGDLELLEAPGEPESEGCGYLPAPARGSMGWWLLLLLPLAAICAWRVTRGWKRD
jgi:hypothetical protein